MKAANEGAPTNPWNVPVTIHDVPETGRRIDLRADAPTRAAVAKAAGLRALPRLEASFELTRHGRDGLRVAGRVSATVGQVCVVTLDPIESGVDEAVDLIFDPGAGHKGEEPAGRAAQGAKVAASVEVPADDTPEPLVGDTVDLGAVAVEFLILGLDPYPRKPGAVFETPPPEDETEHPFAALAKLRSGQGGNER